MNDAGTAMRRLAAQRQRTIRGPVKRSAEGNQIGDAVRRFARHQFDNGGIAETRASCHRVGGMPYPAIVIPAHGGGDAALGPRRWHRKEPARLPASTRQGKGRKLRAP